MAVHVLTRTTYNKCDISKLGVNFQFLHFPYFIVTSSFFKQTFHTHIGIRKYLEVVVGTILIMPRISLGTL